MTLKRFIKFFMHKSLKKYDLFKKPFHNNHIKFNFFVGIFCKIGHGIGYCNVF